MRIRFLTNIGKRDWDSMPLPIEGEEMDVYETTAQRFIARGWAVDITPQPPTPVIQAIPVPPPIAEAKLPEIIPAEAEPPHAEAERDLRTYIDKQRRKPKQ